MPPAPPTEERLPATPTAPLLPAVPVLPGEPAVPTLEEPANEEAPAVATGTLLEPALLFVESPLSLKHELNCNIKAEPIRARPTPWRFLKSSIRFRYHLHDEEATRIRLWKNPGARACAVTSTTARRSRHF